MTNEHHASYWNMKPSANLDAAVLSKVTRKARLAILGNILPICDPVRMAEALAMLDCYSGGRLISGFVRGGAAPPRPGLCQAGRRPPCPEHPRPRTPPKRGRTRLCNAALSA